MGIACPQKAFLPSSLLQDFISIPSPVPKDGLVLGLSVLARDKYSRFVMQIALETCGAHISLESARDVHKNGSNFLLGVGGGGGGG